MFGVPRSRLTRILLTGALVSSSLVVPTLLAPPAAASDVRLTVTTVVDGLDIPWDLTFTPDGTMLYDQRAGGLWARSPGGTVSPVSADLTDLWASGETGLMGMVVDPDFASNRLLYTCQGYHSGSTTDIRVIRWQLNDSYTTATRQGGPVVSGISAGSGRHGGCRLRFDNDKNLYVSTGDAAVGTYPQDLTSLNGKVLRVTTAGQPAPGNPFASSSNPATRLIYTYGHRNVQGLALRPGTNQMWSVEQGTDRDDEVNRLVAGRNYGYNPVPGYNESVPMTDLSLPNAKAAIFTTGFPTLALSGGMWLSGASWGRWDGAFVAAALKASTLRVLTVTGEESLVRIDNPAELDGTYGRLRSPQLGPDGALYLTTGNGGGKDKILRIAPTAVPGDGRCVGGPDRVAGSVGAVVDNGTVTAHTVGMNDAVWYRSIDAGPFRTLGGIVRYAPAPASSGGRSTDLFVVGYEGNLNHRAGTGTDWPGTWENLGGVLTSSPAAVSFRSGTLDIFGRGTDKALWTIRWTGTSWTGWERIGGTLTSAPGAAVDPDTGVARIGVRGTDGRIWEMTRRADGTGSGWASTGIAICSAPAYAARSGDGESFTTAYVLADGSTEVLDGGAITNIGGNVQGSVALQRTSGGYAVFGRGQSGSLWTFDARSGGGSWRDLGGLIR